MTSIGSGLLRSYIKCDVKDKISLSPSKKIMTQSVTVCIHYVLFCFVFLLICGDKREGFII